ncbi:MAG: hypothetical protein GC129_00390 [Proteobacteria bacterium]|nr:hypothetical protein [Pseudomonadota bacterium]
MNRQQWVIGGVAAVIVAVGAYAWLRHDNGEPVLSNPPYTGMEPAEGGISGTTMSNPSSTALTVGEISESAMASVSAPMPLNLGAVPGLTGVWATSEEACADKNWHIMDTAVMTDANASCDLNSLSQQGDGTLTVGMQCAPEGHPGQVAPETWKIDTSRLGSNAVSVNRYGQGTVELVRCGAVGS